MNICLVSFQKLPCTEQNNGRKKILAVFARKILQEALTKLEFKLIAYNCSMLYNCNPRSRNIGRNYSRSNCLYIIKALIRLAFIFPNEFVLFQLFFS